MSLKSEQVAMWSQRAIPWGGALRFARPGGGPVVWSPYLWATVPTADMTMPIRDRPA